MAVLLGSPIPCLTMPYPKTRLHEPPQAAYAAEGRCSSACTCDGKSAWTPLSSASTLRPSPRHEDSLVMLLVASLLLVARPGAPSSFLLLLVRHLFLVAMHLLLVASLLPVARPGAPSVLAPNSVLCHAQSGSNGVEPRQCFSGRWTSGRSPTFDGCSASPTHLVAQQMHTLYKRVITKRLGSNNNYSKLCQNCIFRSSMSVPYFSNWTGVRLGSWYLLVRIQKECTSQTDKNPVQLVRWPSSKGSS